MGWRENFLIFKKPGYLTNGKGLWGGGCAQIFEIMLFYDFTLISLIQGGLGTGDLSPSQGQFWDPLCLQTA